MLAQVMSGRPAVVLPAVQRTAAPQRRRRTVACSASATSEALAAQVAEKERELQAMFEPGKAQPKAATVAALRKEIATLRGQLQGELGIGQPSSILSNSPAAGSAAAPSSAAARGVAPSAAQKRLLDALKLAEAQMAASRQAEPGSLSQLSLEQQQELLCLQDENMALKAWLDIVQARQAQLLQLYTQHLVSKASTATPVTSRSSSSSSNNAYLSGTAPAPKQAAVAVSLQRPATAAV